MIDFPNDVKLHLLALNISAGSTPAYGVGYVDGAGFEGCTFFDILGTVAGGCEPQTFIQVSDDADEWETIESSYSDVIESGSNTIAISNIHQPQKRYLRPGLLRTGGNAVVEAIVAAQYNADSKPVTQDDTVSSVHSVLSD